jgi:diaminopimelate decarboxylase
MTMMELASTSDRRGPPARTPENEGSLLAMVDGPAWQDIIETGAHATHETPERTTMQADIFYEETLLMVDRLPITSVAEEFGTPVYVYAAGSVRSQAARLLQTLGKVGALYYAVKANANPAILALVFSMGLGADVVSRGEMQAAMDAGCPADRIVFSGVGKTHDELVFALDSGVFINAESEEELASIADIRTGVRVGIRVNPGVDAHTHQYLTTGTEEDKFGIPLDFAPDAFAHALAAGLIPDTISCHIGSQVRELEPYRKSLARLLELRDVLMSQGIPITGLDLGGGFAIGQDGRADFPVEDLQALVRHDVPRGLALSFEPGRYVVAHAGLLVTRVLYRKRYARTFVVADAGMNDFLRPALYQARHPVLPVVRRTSEPVACDIVGPVCESADCFARDVTMPLPEQGDLLAICDAGAYGWSMSSTYNARPLLPEVMIDDGEPVLIRSRGV